MNSKFAKSKDDPGDEKMINCKGTSKQTPSSPLPMKELLRYGYRLLEYVSDDYLYITFGLLAVLTNSVTNLAFPWIIGQAVDKASKGQNSAQFKSYLLTSSAILILGSVSSFLRVYCLGISNYRIVIRMKQSLYENYLQQDLEFFDQSQCGELITILDKDIQSASLVYTDILTSTLRSVNSAINGSILLYLNSPKLCGITLLSVPIVGIGAMVMAINSSKQSTALRNFSSNSLSHTIEKLNNMTTIKINGKEKFELETFQKMLQGCYDSAKKMFTAQGAFMSYLNLTTNGCLILVLYVGGSMLGTGEITSGKLTTFALQTGFVGLGYSGLSTAYSELREALMACQR
jgi:ABC-type multidrug transport system fused ATPase/permease subunit